MFPPPFPISTADAVACRNALRDGGQTTAADRVPGALEFAHELGLEVECDLGPKTFCQPGIIIVSDRGPGPGELLCAPLQPWHARRGARLAPDTEH